MSYKTFEETKIAQFSKREMFIQFVNRDFCDCLIDIPFDTYFMAQRVLARRFWKDFPPF